MPSSIFDPVKIQRYKQSIFRLLAIGTLLFLTLLMMDITLDYFPVQTDVAFLRIKQWVFRSYSESISNLWFIAFYIHVTTAIASLLAGFTQFFDAAFARKIHRTMGWFYCVVVLCLAAPSGLIMSFFANGGFWSQLAFTLLSLLWILSTGLALYFALKKKIDHHRSWMIISYALTLSALSLRAWKWGLVNLTPIEINPMDLYRIIAWLGWVPNLIVALAIIYLSRKKTAAETSKKTI